MSQTETCFVVRSNDGRMIKNSSYGELTRSLIHAKKWTSRGPAGERCEDQNRIVNDPSITTPLRGLTFTVEPVELKLV